jgi:hypothetical protein
MASFLGLLHIGGNILNSMISHVWQVFKLHTGGKIINPIRSLVWVVSLLHTGVKIFNRKDLVYGKFPCYTPEKRYLTISDPVNA